MPDYPVVKIPQRFVQINQASIPLPHEPKKPVEPIEPGKPEMPDLLVVKKTFASSGCLISLIMYAISVAVILIGGGNSAATIVGIILLLIAILRPFGSDYKRAEKANDEKRKAYAVVLERYNKEKKAYDESKIKYISDLSVYNSSLNNYKILIKERENKDYEWKILKYREDLMLKALSDSAKPVYAQGQYKSGVTEEWFFKKMVDFFSGHDYSLPGTESGNRVMLKEKHEVKVLRQHVIADKDMVRPYMSDFIISIASTKQSLVIEIDEPYVGSNGNPIHYVNSRDDYRDKYFLANGWIIIRFAEEQIVKNPFACCCFIVDVLLANTPSYEMACIQHSMAHYWDEVLLNKIPQWTEKQAHQMAYSNYRNTYLPSQLATKITKEEYIPAKSIDAEIRTTFNQEEYDEREKQRRVIDEDEHNNHLPF